MPLQYRKRISASETVCELRFGVLSKKRQLSSMFGYTQIEGLHILPTES